MANTCIIEVVAKRDCAGKIQHLGMNPPFTFLYIAL